MCWFAIAGFGDVDSSWLYWGVEVPDHRPCDLFLCDDDSSPVGSFQKSAGRPDLAACLCRSDARDQSRVATARQIFLFHPPDAFEVERWSEFLTIRFFQAI